MQAFIICAIQRKKENKKRQKNMNDNRKIEIVNLLDDIAGRIDRLLDQLKSISEQMIKLQIEIYRSDEEI